MSRYNLDGANCSVGVFGFNHSLYGCIYFLRRDGSVFKLDDEVATARKVDTFRQAARSKRADADENDQTEDDHGLGRVFHQAEMGVGEEIARQGG